MSNLWYKSLRWFAKCDVLLFLRHMCLLLLSFEMYYSEFSLWKTISNILKLSRWHPKVFMALLLYTWYVHNNLYFLQTAREFEMKFNWKTVQIYKCLRLKNLNQIIRSEVMVVLIWIIFAVIFARCEAKTKLLN